MEEKIFARGKFEIGCNYWASHAGTAMWHEWNEKIVEEDLIRLKEAKIRIIRMFPLWSDFQPIKMHYMFAGNEREMRIGEAPLDLSTPEGEAGIDPIMVERFERFCALAEKHGFKLVVGLITGWMSGRLFIPPALERLNVLTNAEAILWEIKFVRYMVRRFKNEPTILAWDLGNECNCLAPADRYDFLRWVADISMAIRSEDNSRPVVSGMHGIFPDNESKPTPSSLRADCDILTTHPYPLFTRHCNTDPLGEMKSALHATAESLLQADIARRPCIVEEIGTLGQTMVSDEIGAYYARTSCLSAWAHDLRAFLWWCANEQLALKNTPYDWNAVERELGLFYLDGTPKPLCRELTGIQGFVDSFEERFGTLPPRLTDAVCIITRDQDSWGVAFGAFMLAKQAGLDISFAYAEDVIPDADAYMLPSLAGDASINKYKIDKMLERVEQGAVLYLSNDAMMFSEFERITGNRVDTRTSASYAYEVDIPGTGKAKLAAKADIILQSVRSRVITRDENGTPAFTVCDYGKGKVYYCNYPIERIAGTQPGVISGKKPIPLYHFYECFDMRNSEKKAFCNNPYIGITEHIAEDGKHFLFIINYDKNDIETEIRLDGKRLSEFMPFGKSEASAREGGFVLKCEHNSAAIALIS